MNVFFMLQTQIAAPSVFWWGEQNCKVLHQCYTHPEDLYKWGVKKGFSLRYTPIITEWGGISVLWK